MRLPNPIMAAMGPAGDPDGREITPRCPVCGEECERIYKDRELDVVGCDVCISSIDAWREAV